MTMRSSSEPVHPGETRREEFLVPLGGSANGLAGRLDIPVSRLTEIIRGRRRITGKTALLRGRVFGTPPEFWLNLRSHYDLEVAKARVLTDRLRRVDRAAKAFRAA
ncbi:MAG: HigA family addiction module antitoxin [Roseiarcus sp.]